ncbi:hypothetical protein [Ruegeria arenilitoris]|uniref:hypothetical protein n=1 Tax=Ruegeria arenilitoris TaxID=1173585 RepID=UPI00147A7760|nr:hypothetical protein [Ruegeria arenilitoris]
MTKALLVDDNEMNREMPSRRLARKGYLVVVAKGGLEAGCDDFDTKPVEFDRLLEKKEK